MVDLDFDKLSGLIPAVLQTGYATFFSRTRNQLWTKGETSGNRAQVISVCTDCDRDTLLLRVRVQGDGFICHQGSVSCFTRDLRVEAAGIPGGEVQ